MSGSDDPEVATPPPEEPPPEGPNPGENLGEGLPAEKQAKEGGHENGGQKKGKPKKRRRRNQNYPTKKRRSKKRYHRWKQRSAGRNGRGGRSGRSTPAMRKKHHATFAHLIHDALLRLNCGRTRTRKRYNGFSKRAMVRNIEEWYELKLGRKFKRNLEASLNELIAKKKLDCYISKVGSKHYSLTDAFCRHFERLRVSRGGANRRFGVTIRESRSRSRSRSPRKHRRRRKSRDRSRSRSRSPRRSPKRRRRRRARARS